MKRKLKFNGLMKLIPILIMFIVMYTSLQSQTATTITLGSGTSQSGAYDPSPANVFWESRHLQFVYTKSEINAQGISGPHLLKSIAFNVSQVADKTHSNYKIRIGHTTATDASSNINTTLTQVYSASSVSFNSSGWKTFTFTTPFQWNGIDNIVVDICWGVNSDYSGSGQVYVYTPEVTNGIGYINSSSQSMCSEAITGSMNLKPQVKLTFEPTAPSNDDCSGAIALTVHPTTTCTNATIGDVSGATNSNVTGCSYGTPNDDVWYKFIATATEHIITVVGSSDFDAVLELRSGSCPGTNIVCKDSTLDGGTEIIHATGLTVGNTYYVRVYDWYSTMPSTTTFTICITTNATCQTPGPPTNLQVTPTQTGASFTWSAPTNPPGTPTIVYYWLVSDQATPNWNNYIARCGDADGFSGNTNGTGQCLVPAGMPATLSPNTQYYLHMYARTSCDWTGSPWATKAFTTLSAAPSNDNCSGAITLTVNNTANCVNPTTGNVAGATNSGVTGCTGTPDDDVWYKFIATATEHTITVVGSSDFDAVVDLRSGSCPGTNITCIDATLEGGTEVINATGLTIGNTYYVRVYHYYATAPTTTTFTICITTPQTGAAPVADFTANATTITVGGSVTFTDLSSNNPTSWNWQFAVGEPSGTCTPATSTLQNKTVVYNTPGIYTVKLTVSNAYGSDTEEKIDYITVNPATSNLTITASAQPNNVCAGSTVQLNAIPTGGSGTYTYSWSSNPQGFTSTLQNPTATPTNNTIYSVTVTSGSSTASASCSVTVNPLPSTPNNISGPVSVCIGSTNISYNIPSIPNATGYVWTVPSGFVIVSGQNTNNLIVNIGPTASSGNITVAGTNSCGNGPTKSLAVTVSPALVVSAGTTQTITSGSTATLHGSANGGSGNYSYSWQPSNLLQNPNIQNPTTIPLTSSQTFTLIATDNTTGCQGTATVQIIVSGGSLSVNASANPSIVCQGTSVSLQATPSGGTGSYTYSWASNPSSSIPSTQNPTVTPSTNTTYTVTVTSGSSTASASCSVTVNPLPGNPGPITGSQTVCQGQTDVYYGISPVANATSYSWLLPTGAVISSGTNTNSILVNFSQSATSGNISVVASNSCGNSQSSSNFYVTVNPLPAAASNISGPSTVTLGQTNVTYLVQPIAYATGYVWSIPQGFNLVSGLNTNTIVVNISPSATNGVITVYGTNNCGNGATSPAFPVSVQTTNINEIQNINCKIYPNPSDGKIYIDLKNNTIDNLSIAVFNSIGMIVWEQKLDNGSFYSLDLVNLTDGVYYLQLNADSFNHIEKLIINR